jgi:uncharacterized membrane protein/Flp pilus assembly pilin Flp
VRIRLAVAGLLLALFVYDGVVRPLVALPAVPGGLNTLTVILVVFGLWHASHTLGTRPTVAFFAITAAMSWIFEEVGVTTGRVFGAYHYTATLGPWLGSVPVLIPLAWFMMLYPSYLVANLIVDGRLMGTPGSHAHLLRLALIGALVMAVWDLLADPILSGPTYRAWVWDAGGPYFGVPIQNSVGWVATTFVIFVAYRWLERRWTPRPAGELSRPARATPVGAHLAMLLDRLQSSALAAAKGVAGRSATGVPGLAAFLRLRGPSVGPATPVEPVLVNAERTRLRRGTDGQGFIEYGLLLALMAIVAILALTLFGAQISNLVNMFAQ